MIMRTYAIYSLDNLNKDRQDQDSVHFKLSERSYDAFIQPIGFFNSELEVGIEKPGTIMRHPILKFFSSSLFSLSISMTSRSEDSTI